MKKLVHALKHDGSDGKDAIDHLHVYVVTAIIYLNDLALVHHYTISPSNVRSLFISALIVAFKFQDDRPYNNKSWANLYKIDIDRLNAMEIDFCKMMRWQLWSTTTTSLFDEQQDTT
jgi:hypothetical protein